MNLERLTQQIVSIEALPTHRDLAIAREDIHYETSLFYDYNLYQIWTKEFVTGLAKAIKRLELSPVIEICAGNGKLSYHLRRHGVDIIATDDYSMDYSTPAFVERLSHKEALKRYNPAIVVASWIPMNSDIGEECLRYPSVRKLLAIGDGGCSSYEKICPLADHEYLDQLDKYTIGRTLACYASVFTPLPGIKEEATQREEHIPF
jgi:hypothetical protein